MPGIQDLIAEVNAGGSDSPQSLSGIGQLISDSNGGKLPNTFAPKKGRPPEELYSDRPPLEKTSFAKEFAKGLPGTIKDIAVDVVKPPSLLDLLDPNTKDVKSRLQRGMASGALSSTSSFIKALPLIQKTVGIQPGMVAAGAEKVAAKLDEVAARLSPADPKFLDHLASGAGSMAAFMLPGSFTAKGVAALALKAPKIASAVGTGTATILESYSEAGTIYNDLKKHGMDPDLAEKKANQALMFNLVLLSLTNKVSNFFGPEAKTWTASLRAALSEGVQEGGQYDIERRAKGESFDWRQFLLNSSIGGILGGGAKTMELGAEAPAVQQGSPAVAPVQEAPAPITQEAQIPIGAEVTAAAAPAAAEQSPAIQSLMQEVQAPAAAAEQSPAVQALVQEVQQTVPTSTEKAAPGIETLVAEVQQAAPAPQEAPPAAVAELASAQVQQPVPAVEGPPESKELALDNAVEKMAHAELEPVQVVPQETQQPSTIQQSSAISHEDAASKPETLKDLPAQKSGAKTGPAHALFAYFDPLTGDPVATYNVFGDPKDPLVKAAGHGSSITLDKIKELGIPITGREVRPKPEQQDYQATLAKLGRSPQAKSPIEQAPLGQQETSGGSEELQKRVFPGPKESSRQSITAEPEYIKGRSEAMEIVERHAKQKGVEPTPEFAKSLFHELHDALGDIRREPAATRAQVAKDILAKYPKIESDFVGLKDQLWTDAAEGFYEIRKKHAAEAQAPSGAGRALAETPRQEGEATGPTSTPPGKPPAGTVPPPGDTNEASVIELPEIVNLAKGLLGGKYPIIKEKLSVGGGNAKGVFYPGKMSIELRTKEFKAEEGSTGLNTQEEAAKTLAHEIGHLVDYLPEHTMGRGNILGRIASLKRFLKQSFVDKFGNHIFDAEMRAELQALAQKWRGFTKETVSPAFLKYRFGSDELYAEAWSALLNNPKFLQETAPKFYNALFNFIEAKPHTKALYEDMIQTIRTGSVLEARQDRVEKMFAQGDEAAKFINEERNKKVRFLDEMREIFVDRGSSLISLVAKAEKEGRYVSPEDSPIAAMEELRYSSGEAYAYVQEIDRVYKELKETDVDWDKFGSVLFYDRVLNDRSDLANPEGITPKAAQDQLDLLKKEMGDEKWAKVQDSVDAFRKNRDYLIKRIADENFVSPQLMKKIKENKSYATFDVIEHDLDKAGGGASGVSSMIYKQLGTFKAIKNAATATILKDIALLKAINRKAYARDTHEFLAEHFPHMVTPAKTAWNGKSHVAQDPKDPNLGLVSYPHNGKIVSFYTDRTIADDFNSDPGRTWKIFQAWDALNGVFKDIFTRLRPGFQLFNIPRDFWRTVFNVPGMNVPKLATQYFKAYRHAANFAYEVKDDLVTEMLHRKQLITPENRWGDVAEDREIDSILKRYSDEKNHDRFLSEKLHIGKLINWVVKHAQIAEALPKVASYQYLKDKQEKLGITDKQIDHIIRTQAGSPPFLLGGRGKTALGRVFLFYNPFIQGWRFDIESAKQRPAEYTYKTMKYTILPTFLKVAAVMGLMGDTLKKLYGKVGSSDMMNYHVLAFEGPGDKAIVVRLPMTETQRALAGLIYNVLTTKKVGDLSRIFSYGAGQLPNLTPIISLIGDVRAYMSGRNPFDDFHGRYAIPERIFEAGGKRSLEAFLKYEWNQLGGSIVHRFDTTTVEKFKTAWERAIGGPVMSDTLGRFVKFTNYGEFEKIQEVLRQTRKEARNKQLDLQDAVASHVVARDEPAPMEEIGQFYKKLIDAGIIEKGAKMKTPGQFITYYRRLEAQRHESAYGNGIVFAQSNAEKAVALRYARENMSEPEFTALFNDLVKEGHLKGEAIAEEKQLSEGE